MHICNYCGLDLDRPAYYVNGDEMSPEYSQAHNHDCACIYESFDPPQYSTSKRKYEKRYRAAVGICCGHMLGDALMREEDFHDGAPWSVFGDCTCPPLDTIKEIKSYDILREATEIVKSGGDAVEDCNSVYDENE